MLPYFLLLFFSVFSPLVFYHSEKAGKFYDQSDIIRKRNKISVSVFFGGLFILLSLRDVTVGTDLLTYKSFYEICSRTSFENLSRIEWEKGYTVYNKLVSLVSKDYRFFLVVTAFITLRPIYKLYSKESKFSFLLIVLFINMPCFLMMFSGLRQAIATSIGVLAYMAIEKKKNIWGGLLILLAISFHASAFVLFLLYPAFYLKIKTKHLLWVVPALIIIYIYRIPIFALIIGLVPNKYVEFYGELQQTGAFGMMILFLLFLVFSFVILDESIMSAKDYSMRNILMIATVVQLFVPIHGLIQRASYYFLVFAPISILSIVKAPKRNLKSISDIAVIVMSGFFLLYFFYTAIFSTDNLLNVFPYKFFWSGQKW